MADASQEKDWPLLAKQKTKRPKVHHHRNGQAKPPKPPATSSIRPETEIVGEDAVNSGLMPFSFVVQPSTTSFRSTNGHEIASSTNLQIKNEMVHAEADNSDNTARSERHQQQRGNQRLAEKSGLTAVQIAARSCPAPAHAESAFRCDVCDRTFTNNSHLIRHLRIHTGERPFKCNVCDMAFNNTNHLNRHSLIHTGEKMYRCAECPKCYNDKSHLIRHYKSHTGEKPFECEVCLSRFTERANLISHLRVHTGEKPFLCEVCLSKFSDKPTLKRHQMIHTGEKPFECHVCKYKFSRKSHLKRHMGQIHSRDVGLTKQ